MKIITDFHTRRKNLRRGAARAVNPQPGDVRTRRGCERTSPTPARARGSAGGPEAALPSGPRVGPGRELRPTQVLGRGGGGRDEGLGKGKKGGFIFFFNETFGGWSKYWNFSLSLCQLSACGKLPSGINVL